MKILLATLAFLFVAGFFTANPGRTIFIDTTGSQTKSGYATDAQVKEAMTANEPAFKAQLKRHMTAMDEYIEAGKMDEYPSFVLWLNSRPEDVLVALEWMHDSTDGLVYDDLCHPSISGGAYWVYNDQYPYIHVCRTALSKFENSIGPHSHEVNHFNPSNGFGSFDHTYSSEECKGYAESSSPLAVNTASCISSFIQSEPPILISRMQVAGALSAISVYLME